MRRRIWQFVLVAGLAGAAIAVACGGDTKVIEKIVEVPVEKIVLQEVIVEVPVEKIVTKEVERIITKEVPVEVEKIVTKEVEKVVTQTIEKVVDRIVVASPTPSPITDVSEPKGRIGSITFVEASVRKSAGTNGTQSMNYRFGLTEAPFMTEWPGEVKGMLVQAWERSADGGTLRLQAREGVEFHKGWGPYTADDLAWNLNDTNGSVNTESISWNAGDYAGLFGEAVVVNGWVELPVKNWDVRWAANQLNMESQTMEIFSMKACAEMGTDWCNRNIIGTGPFELVEYRDNERVIGVALDKHWLETPQFERIVFIEVPEAATRRAMMLTGEADVGDLTAPDQADLLARGYRAADSHGWNERVTAFSGNFWELTNVQDGSALEPWNTLPFAKDLPWVGAPSDWAVPYTDTDNPAGMDDMEQARLFRHALSMAIDRELINEQLFSSLGVPFYINMFNPTDPNFQDKWIVSYDPAAAEAMLDKAGYPRGNGGVRVEVELLTSPGANEEVQEAVAGFWDAVGIKSTAIVNPYSTYRPTLVDRTTDKITTHGCRHNNGLPWDWPRGAQATSLTRGGFGCSTELPFVLEAFQATNLQDDTAARIEINNAMAEQMFHWMPYAGLVAIPKQVIYNPKAIAKWEMRDCFECLHSAQARIVPAKR
jgi:ABC-type transport system substrate-binding protein